jgi:hypothetical protein
MGEHTTRDYAASSAPRRFLAQSKMGAVFMMVGDVLGKKPLQVPLVESNHRVEQLAAAAPHLTLGDTILPRTFERAPHGIYFHGSNGCRDLGAVFCIPVMDQKSWSRPERKRLRNCWMIQLLVGCFLTLKCRIRRRSWPMTKKQ